MNACSTYTLACLVSKIIQYLQIGIMLIISLAVVTFIWNVYRYFFKAEADAEHRKEAGLYVMYSTIGFFVILSFWGLVAILANTLNLPNAQPMWPFGGGGSSQTGTNIFQGTNSGGTGGTNIFQGTNSGGGRNIYQGTNSGGSGTVDSPDADYLNEVNGSGVNTTNYQPNPSFNGIKPTNSRVNEGI